MFPTPAFLYNTYNTFHSLPVMPHVKQINKMLATVVGDALLLTWFPYILHLLDVADGVVDDILYHFAK